MYPFRPFPTKTAANVSTADIDALPFVPLFSPFHVQYCPECHRGGTHAPSCSSKPALRPYFRPDLPSPRPDRPAFPAVLLTGPPGCGKTTLIHVACRTAGLRVVEMTGEIGGVSAEETLRNLAGVFDTNGLDFGNRQPPCIVFVTPLAMTQNQENFDTMFSTSERRKIAGFLSARYQSAEKEGKLRLVPVVFTCTDLVEIVPIFHIVGLGVSSVSSVSASVVHGGNRGESSSRAAGTHLRPSTHSTHFRGNQAVGDPRKRGFAVCGGSAPGGRSFRGSRYV